MSPLFAFKLQLDSKAHSLELFQTLKCLNKLKEYVENMFKKLEVIERLFKWNEVKKKQKNRSGSVAPLRK